MEKQQKIDALKNPNLNPYNLSSAYDGLANSMHRWTVVAKDAQGAKYTPDQEQKIASNYYDKMIAPLYGKLGIAPMDKALWMKQAYKEALNYNIEDSYNNNIIHQMRHGFDSGIAATARAYGTATDILGNLVDIKFNTSGILKDSALQRGARIQDQNHQFWADALPDRDGWFNHATSLVTEQAAQLPLYAAMSLSGGLTEGNLTKGLMASPIGKKVLGYLMAGGEGLAYGTLTRPQEDKGQAWRDAVGFAVFHGLFHVGGAATKKLIDIVPTDSNLMDRLKAKQDKYELAQKGLREATPTERYAAHTKEISNNLAVMGIPGQQKVFNDALTHISDMEGRGWTTQQVKDHEQALLSKDPARFSPMLSAASFIRSNLSLMGKRLSELEEGSPEAKSLVTKMAKLIDDAGMKMNTNVHKIEEITGQEVAAQVKESSAKPTMDMYRAKVIAQVAKDNPTAAKMLKPEEIDKLATIQMTKDSVRAARLAEKKLGQAPVEKVDSAAKKNKALPPPEMKTRSERKMDKYGQPSASFSITPSYKVPLKNYMKEASAKGQSLKEFFEDMADEDFASDVSEHFYPKALKDAGVYFEKQNTKEGIQNPNFLAFMYNYLDKMPKEFGQALEGRLVESMKVQKYMSGRTPSEAQLMYYAKSMYNHMDNFLSSGRWPKESNIFRSTQADMWNPTKWQRQLLRERSIQEKKNIKDMFSSDPAAQRAALTAHKLFSDQRMTEFDKADKKPATQDKILELSEKIADIEVSSGDRERIPF
jgi:hypothetical protein